MPDSLVYLWKKGMPGRGFVLRIPSQSLPELLRYLEPCLDVSDYVPRIEHWWLRRVIFWILSGILFLVPLWSIMAASFILFRDEVGRNDLWMVVACAAATALFVVVDLYGFQRPKKRRVQQMKWVLGKDPFRVELNAEQLGTRS